MSLQDIYDADRRLVILRILSEDAGYSVNSSLMQSALAHVGHDVSRDRVRADFAWLAEQGLVTVRELSADLHLALLTERGGDVAAGRATCPGVARPGPDG